MDSWSAVVIVTKRLRGGGGGIPCLRKSESANCSATKAVPIVKSERTDYVGLAKVAHEKQWTVAVISFVLQRAQQQQHEQP